MPFEVLIIDDSGLVRKIVRDILERNVKGIDFCTEARNGEEGLERILRCRPDLVILDVEMPRMDGLTLLRELKKLQVRPAVLMLSALTQHGAHVTFEALELGALDFVPKPDPGSGLRLKDIENLLVHKVQETLHILKESEGERAGLNEAPLQGRHTLFHYDLLVIGSSTGGPQALHTILKDLPGDFPSPIVIVQHMPPVFTKAFADRLNNLSALHVEEARDGTPLNPGEVVVAPGNHHLLVERFADGNRVRLDDGPPVHAHRPSIDVTLESVVKCCGARSAALIMTGMGWDGARGMKHLYDIGGLTLAQDEASSVIFGMNRRAIELGGIIQVLPLKNVVEVLLTYFNY